MCNRNKTAARFLAAFLAVATLVSCQEDYGEPDAFIDVPENDITVDFNGLNSAGKVPYVEIGSNVPWSVTECPQWVTPSTMSSDRGRLNVFFVCEENLSGGSGQEREGICLRGRYRQKLQHYTDPESGDA